MVRAGGSTPFACTGDDRQRDTTASRVSMEATTSLDMSARLPRGSYEPPVFLPLFMQWPPVSDGALCSRALTGLRSRFHI